MRTSFTTIFVSVVLGVFFLQEGCPAAPAAADQKVSPPAQKTKMAMSVPILRSQEPRQAEIKPGNSNGTIGYGPVIPSKNPNPSGSSSSTSPATPPQPALRGLEPIKLPSGLDAGPAPATSPSSDAGAATAVPGTGSQTGSQSSSQPGASAPGSAAKPGGEPGSGSDYVSPQAAKERAHVSGTIEYNTNQPVPEGLTLLEALNEALIKGPRAAAIRANLPIAKSGIAQAAMSPNPSFFMDRGFVAEAVERRGVVSTLDPPWKIAFRMMAATRLYHQTKTDLMATLWQLRADVRRAYTEAVIAQETERTLSQLYDLTNRLLEVSTKRFNAGDVPELDVLRARLASSQAGVDLGVGRQRLIRAKQQLDVILGRAVENPIAVPRLPEFIGVKRVVNPRAIRHGILPDFTRNTQDINHFLAMAMENRLELKSLNQQIRVNNMNYKNAIASIVPNPSMAYGSSTNSNLPTGPKLRAQFMTLNIEMPFCNTNQGDVTKYRAIGKQLRYQIQSQRNLIQSEVSSAFNNLLAARDKIHAYQQHVLNDSNEVARLARRSYEVGQSDINSTLLAQQANIQIQMQYLDAVTTYQQAYTDLEQACGTPLE